MCKFHMLKTCRWAQKLNVTNKTLLISLLRLITLKEKETEGIKMSISLLCSFSWLVFSKNSTLVSRPVDKWLLVLQSIWLSCCVILQLWRGHKKCKPQFNILLLPKDILNFSVLCLQPDISLCATEFQCGPKTIENTSESHTVASTDVFLKHMLLPWTHTVVYFDWIPHTPSCWSSTH